MKSSDRRGDPFAPSQVKRLKARTATHVLNFFGGKRMPNIKSAKKRVLVNQQKALRNKMLKSKLKTEIKKFNDAVASGNKEEASAAYRLAVKKVDQAVSHGILHKNTAARKKSALTVKFNTIA